MKEDSPPNLSGEPFLPEGKNYIAEIYTDGDKSVKTRTKVKVSTYRVSNKTRLDFCLKASGGSAVRLVPDTGNMKSIKNYKSQRL